MTDTVFLGIIALATFTMAAIQVGAIVFASRLARRVERLTQQVEQEIRPLLGRLTEVSDDAARASSLAVTQVERFDRVFGDLAQRLEQMMTVAQAAVLIPARQGAAVVAGLRAAVAAISHLRGAARRARRRSGLDDEDALFIG